MPRRRLLQNNGALSREILTQLAQDSSYDIETLAHRTHVSRRTIQRYITSVTGWTPARWLKIQRLAPALILFAERNISCKAAAFTLRYTEPANFSRDFKAVFGVSPSMVRRILAHSDK